MKPGFTLIVIVLDRSGSMEVIRDDTIGGLNQYLNAQRAQPGSCAVTLAQFDEEYELLYNCTPLADVAPRSRANFIPRGWTALHDAMGRTIDEVGSRLSTMPEHERPEHVLFVTMTDGDENKSRIYSAHAVRAKVERQRSLYKWEFVFLGANQDAVLTARTLGIGAGSTMSYAANTVGTRSVMDSMSAHTNSYRATGMSVNFSKSEKLAQFAVGAMGDPANDPLFDPDAAQAVHTAGAGPSDPVPAGTAGKVAVSP